MVIQDDWFQTLELVPASANDTASAPVPCDFKDYWRASEHDNASYIKN